MGSAMPMQRPATSRQDFATPADFTAAVKKLLNIEEFTVDLAASADNTKATMYISEQTDSFKADWSLYTTSRLGWAWLNPPFGNIEPFARKCAESRAWANIALLVPASVGANWWKNHVSPYAMVHHCVGRISFDGKGGYPKDCSLVLYGPGFVPCTTLWEWRKQA